MPYRWILDVMRERVLIEDLDSKIFPGKKYKGMINIILMLVLAKKIYDFTAEKLTGNRDSEEKEEIDWVVVNYDKDNNIITQNINK